jgi:branched-chain amino acid transport system substrate-binding protein
MLAAASILLAAACNNQAATRSEFGVDSPNCSAVEYRGSGTPDAVIVSDLPMRGGSATRSKQQVEAIRLALQNHDYRAGSVKIGLQVCDDTLVSTGLWDETVCASNAHAYVAEERLLGVIGTYNSGCAAVEIPILNRAGVAMVSPGNTSVCLTQESPLCGAYSPKTLYPTGERNYARVIPNDAYQGAALAEFARAQGVRRPYVLYAIDDTTSTGQATNFRGGAQKLGLTIAGFRTWDPKGKSYTSLFEDVKRSGADAVVLAGLIEHHGRQVIEDKVSVLGDNATVKVFAYDGFVQQSTIDQAGPAATGMFGTIPGRALAELPSEGDSFAKTLASRLGVTAIENFAPYGGEAAEVLIAAIAKAGTDRAAVPAAMLRVERRNGILGSYTFEASGDPSAGPVTVFVAAGRFKVRTLVTPNLSTVAAARG